MGSQNPIEGAKRALDVVRRAVLTRRITANEANAAPKAISEWCKAESAAMTKQLVNELHREMADKERQKEELRQQVSGRGMRVGR